MKRILIFILAAVLALNILALPAFADDKEGQGGDAQTTPIPDYDVRLEIASVNNMFPEANVTVYAGGSFTVAFRLVGADVGSGSVRASVSGTGFSMDGSSATRYWDSYDGGDLVIPIKVGTDLKTGRYSLSISAQYKDDEKNTTVSESVNVNVMGSSTIEPVEPSGEGYVDLSITSAPSGVIAAGDTFDVNFRTSLMNFYSQNSFGYYPIASASRGTVTVEGEGFSLAGALAEEEISTGSGAVSIMVDKKAESGRKTLKLTVTFIVDGKSYTASRSLNINVESQSEEEEVDETKENAAFSLISASIPEKKGRSNLSTKLTLEFKNTSAYEASNVKIKLTGFGDGSTILLDTFTDTVDIGDVLPDKTFKAVFPIKFQEYPVAQPSLTASVTYGTATAQVNSDFTVYLQATEKEKKEEDDGKTASLTPKVIVKSFSVNPEEVVSGEEFDLSFVLENTSSEKDLRNMTVNIDVSKGISTSGGTSATSSGPVFSFVNGTSSFYSDLLEKSSDKEYTLRLKCNAAAGAGTYPIDISFDFEYAQGSGFAPGTGSITINLPVKQPIKFDLMEWEPPKECGPDGVQISFQYFNKSKNPMTALGIGVEGDFTMATQYPGTLAAASYEYFQGTIVPVDPTAVGQKKTAILFFTFEDSAGVEQRIEEKFDVTITETSTLGGGDMMGGDMMGGDVMGGMVTDPEMMDAPVEFDEFGNPITADTTDQESGGLPLWAKIAIPSAIAVVAIVVIVIVVKKVKAKREALEDAEDD